jgi:rRNA-processing protein FCF1
MLEAVSTALLVILSAFIVWIFTEIALAVRALRISVVRQVIAELASLTEYVKFQEAIDEVAAQHRWREIDDDDASSSIDAAIERLAREMPLGHESRFVDAKRRAGRLKKRLGLDVD